MAACSNITQVWSLEQLLDKNENEQTMTPQNTRPTPIRTEGTSTFFDAAKNGELLLKHCQECHQFNLTGHRFCPHCFSMTEWCPSKGIGRISSFSIVSESSHAGFKDLVPYTIAEVTLSEGPSLNLRVVGVKPENIFIGQQVKVDFLDSDVGETTPVWRSI